MVRMNINHISRPLAGYMETFRGLSESMGENRAAQYVAALIKIDARRRSSSSSDLQYEQRERYDPNQHCPFLNPEMYGLGQQPLLPATGFWYRPHVQGP
jgi:hypothetical protein